MNELEKIKILATANMKIAGVPALHKTLEQLLIDEKYEELNVMNQVYENEKGGRVGAEVKVQTVEEELNHIAKRLAALSGMPYCWEDILDRLHHGYQLPFKFEK